MRIKKVVYFTVPGEKTKLNELAEKYPDESALALAINREFNIEFSEAMSIAQIWLEVVKQNKNK